MCSQQLQPLPSSDDMSSGGTSAPMRTRSERWICLRGCRQQVHGRRSRYEKSTGRE